MTVCPKCKGYGIVGSAVPDILRGRGHIFSSNECDRCHGTGEAQMTNEEYLRGAGTDGLTAIFMQFMFDAEFKARFVNGNFITEFRKWLKEKHDGNMGRNP